MASKTLTTTFSEGVTITRFTTKIQDVIDSLNRDNTFIQNYDYQKIAIDSSYMALGLRLKVGGIPSSSWSLALDFGNTFVDGYNEYGASELVVDDWRIAGLI